MTSCFAFLQRFRPTLHQFSMVHHFLFVDPVILIPMHIQFHTYISILKWPGSYGSAILSRCEMLSSPLGGQADQTVNLPSELPSGSTHFAVIRSIRI
jgi:hypothetical protein